MLLLKHIILIVLPIVVNCRENCTQLLGNSDKLFKDVLLIGRHKPLPLVDYGNLTKYCESQNYTLKIFTKWANCKPQNPIEQQFAQSIAFGIKNLLDDRCGDGRREFMLFTKCFISPHTRKRMNFCVDAYIHLLNQLRDEKKTSLKADMNNYCCTNSFAAKCLLDASTSCLVFDNSMKRYLKSRAKILLAYNSLFVDLCDELNNFDKCNKHAKLLIHTHLESFSSILEAETSPLIPLTLFFRHALVNNKS